MCSWSTMGKKAGKLSRRTSPKKKTQPTKQKTEVSGKKLLGPRKWTPHDYQIRTVEHFVSQNQGGMFADPGLGKTSVSLASYKVLKQQGLVDFAVVVAPILVCYNVWPDEIYKWTDFHGLTHTILHGRNKDSLLADKKTPDLYLMNPEGLEWLHDNWPKHWKGKRIMLVIDESTKFKSSDAVRFKIMKGSSVERKKRRKRFKSILKRCDRRYILTGTPAPNGLIDLWGQIYMLDLGAALGEYISYYRNTWFGSTGFQGREYVPVDGAEEQIYEAIAPLVIRLDERDYHEMPPLVGDVTGMSAEPAEGGVGVVEMDLPDEMRDLYDEMDQEFLLLLDDGEVTASSAGVASTKLRQIANGGVYLDPRVGENPSLQLRKEFKQLHYTKAEMTAELLEELSGQPTLVAYEFHHDLYRLKHVLGKKTPHIGKGVPVKESRRIIQAWNAGDLPCLIGQPQSMSHGLNMQDAGRAVIWHSLTWNYENYIQFIRRIWRQGQDNPVFLYHLLMRDTVDYAILYALINKAATENRLLDALKKYGLERATHGHIDLESFLKVA